MGACCAKNVGYSKLDDPEYREFPPLKQNYDENIYCRTYPLQLIEPNENEHDKMKHFKIVFLGESSVGKTSIISQKVSYKFDNDYTPTIEDYFVKVHRINVDDINSWIDDDNNLKHHSSTLSRNESLTQINSHKTSRSYSNRYDNQGINYNKLLCYHCILDIQDTSGAIDFRQNINQWIWRSQIFVIVFDLTKNKTFQSLENSFITRIIELRQCQQPPIILVGNKSDKVLRKSFAISSDIISNVSTISKQITAPPSTLSNVSMTKYKKSNDNDITKNVNKDEREVTSDQIEELCNKYNIPYIESNAKNRLNINHIFDVCIKERLFHEAYHRSEVFMAQRNSSDMY